MEPRGTRLAVGPGLAEKVRDVPDRPGVYLFRDAEGEVIYVGKAVSLRARVRSYFQSGHEASPKVALMVRAAADVETIVTGNEVEALVLEAGLIKRYRPRFNVRLRDDKSYPYLRVSVHEPWPRLSVVRSMRDDGARYFGPYTNSTALQETLRTLRRAFPWRSCSDRRLERGGRPCLYYDIHRCLAPCAGYVTPDAYGAMVRDLVAFLEGRREALVERLETQMREAAGRLDFERAAEIRDQLAALRRVGERQRIVSDRLRDEDVVALARSAGLGCAQVFFVRGGQVVGREHFMLLEVEGEEDAAVRAAFLKSYYSTAAQVPASILLDGEAEDEAAMGEWLSGRAGRRVRLLVPRRGEKRRLVELVAENARQRLAEEAQRARRRNPRRALELLQEALWLAEPPRRIECFDISNVQGAYTVASMVVFEDGLPRRAAYRRFRLRSISGPDDFAAMREVISRRFRRSAGGPGGPDERFASALPDLVIVDGGRGQLSAAREVMRALGVDDIPAFGLAKENEWLFAEDSPDPIILPRDSEELHLVQRLRDEAHRFAVTYHRGVRSREELRSGLDEVAGIGARRRNALLRAFGSVAGMRSAEVEELARVPGMTRRAAEELYAHLHGGEAALPPGDGRQASP